MFLTDIAEPKTQDFEPSCATTWQATLARDEVDLYLNFSSKRHSSSLYFHRLTRGDLQEQVLGLLQHGWEHLDWYLYL